MKKELKIYGLHAVLEAIESGESIEKIYLQKDIQSDTVSNLERLIKKNGISKSVVPIEKLERLSKKNNHQGVVATLSPITYADFNNTIETVMQQKEKPLFLLLDQLTDVRNFGAIIRTAECCGVDAIIIPKSGSAPINSETVKTSAGAVFNIPICKVDHLKDAIFYLKSSDINIIAASEKSTETVFDLDLNQPIALVMGSEGKGVSTGVLKLCDNRARLPIKGTISSLNVSVACGAILYEVLRQQA